MTVLVTDSGSGIPDEYLGKVFDPFFSLKERGSGLGLAIAARIVSGHGGTLCLESTGPEGTTFSTTMPLAGQGD